MSRMDAIQSQFFHLWRPLIFTRPMPQKPQCYLHYSGLGQIVIVHVHIQQTPHSPHDQTMHDEIIPALSKTFRPQVESVTIRLVEISLQSLRKSAKTHHASIEAFQLVIETVMPKGSKGLFSVVESDQVEQNISIPHRYEIEALPREQCQRLLDFWEKIDQITVIEFGCPTHPVGIPHPIISQLVSVFPGYRMAACSHLSIHGGLIPLPLAAVYIPVPDVRTTIWNNSIFRTVDESSHHRITDVGISNFSSREIPVSHHTTVSPTWAHLLLAPRGIPVSHECWNPSTSSSSPSHMILPTRRCECLEWRSKMSSVSMFSNFFIKSLIKLVFSSVALLLWSLSSFKSSRRNSINTSFPVDMTFRTDLTSAWLEFYRFSFLFVPIHKPPIHGFLFDVQKFSYMFYFFQARSFTNIAVIGFQQRLIRSSQWSSLRLFGGNAVNIPAVIVKKHFPVVHTSTDIAQERHVASFLSYLRMSTYSRASS